MNQLAFSLPFTAATSESSFFVSACNQEAYQWVQAWPNWPAHALLLYGPEGSGKTHLAHIWAAKANAISSASAESLSANAVVENIDRRTDQQQLFHLLNTAKEQGLYLLLTSSVAPKQLPFTLPDLTSRILALPAIAITAPDDAALYGALCKQLADRQLKVDEDVIAYLLPRMERSFAKLSQLIDTLDRASLEEKKSLTIPFLKKTLGY